MTTGAGVEESLRRLGPRVLAALVRHFGHFPAAEDAVQEALLAAARQWPEQGVPDRPEAWLITVASRRLTDQLRSEQASRRREQKAARQTRAEELAAPAADAAEPGEDDTLTLLLLCCHASLTPSSQIALTLRAVGGLTTAEIARAFLVPEATMAQRISRTLRRAPLGPYQLQAAIAAVHAEAPKAEDTDWPQIVALYQILEKLDPSPAVTLNQAVAVAMAQGPLAGLALLRPLEADGRMSGHHRLYAVRAHLLEMAGDRESALSCYQMAAQLTTSLPEQRYLDDRAARLR